MATELDDAVRHTLRVGWGLEVDRIDVVARHSFNSIVRAHTPTRSLAVRVGTGPRIHPPDVEPIEAQWLDRLATSGEIVAPRVVRTTGGDVFDRTEEGAVVSVFTWLPGSPLEGPLDRPTAARLGAVLAQLHEHAGRLGDDPAPPAALRLDRRAYFGPDRLGDVAGWPDGLDRHADVVTRACALVDDGLEAMWAEPPHPPHLLHGDFGPRNVLVDDDRIQPIDFQDLRVGFDVLDVGIAVAHLEGLDPDLEAAFVAGYRTVRPLDGWSPEVRRIAVAARHLNLIDLMLDLGRHDAVRVLAERLDRTLRGRP